MRGFMNLAKALADRNRIRILMALRNGPLCVCQITALLGLAPSTVSKHVSILRNAMLVDWVKNGLWTKYMLPESPSSEVAGALEWIFKSLEGEPEIAADAAKLAEILKKDIQDICGL